MKRREIFFVAFCVLLLGFLICGCMTQKKTEKYLATNPLFFAGKCASAFPVKDSIGGTAIIYHPADNVDHTVHIDSLKKAFDHQMEAFKEAQIQQAKDSSCLATIQELQGQYEALAASYTRLKDSYKPCLPDTVTITSTVFHDTNPAKTAAFRLIIARQHMDSIQTAAALVTAQDKATKRGRLMWGTWVALVLLIGGYFFVKSKTQLLTSVIRQFSGRI